MPTRTNLPGFLIIGAMKSGTTTLFDDLSAHPALFGPDVKEPGTLKDDRINDKAVRHQYEHLFSRAAQEQISFEASTQYTHLPVFTGVAQRARSILGPELRVVYVVREPIARIVSQHHHWLVRGVAPADIGEAVRADHRFIDYTRYHMQIRPWIDALGADRVLVLRFDELVSMRRDFVACVESFVGVEPRPDLVEEERVSNPSIGKRVPTRLASAFTQIGIYRDLIRPALPRNAREFLKSCVTRPTEHEPILPDDTTAALILDRLAEDLEGLRELLRHPLGGAAPVWTPEESLAALERRRERASQSDASPRTG